jgi:hypothetical protein
VGNEKIEYFTNVLYGSSNSGWFSYYDFMIFCLKVKIDKNVLKNHLLDRQTVENGFWYYCFKNIAICCERPKEIHINQRGLLHNTNGPAVKFRDGFSVYSLNGIRVPEKIVITSTDKLNGKDALEETNIDIRREFIRKIGIEKFIKDAGAKTADTWGFSKNGEDYIYELLKVDLGNDIGIHSFLKMSMEMKNGETLYFVEGVSDDCKGAKEAYYWRYPYLEGKETLPEFVS